MTPELPSSLETALKQEARRRHTSAKDIVTVALAEYLEDVMDARECDRILAKDEKAIPWEIARKELGL